MSCIVAIFAHVAAAVCTKLVDIYPTNQIHAAFIAFVACGVLLCNRSKSVYMVCGSLFVVGFVLDGLTLIQW